MFLTIIFAFSTGKTVHGLRINKLEVPSSVPNGTSIVLYCDYDLEGLGLYSVKWYKNYVEFFRYIPSEDEKVATFKLDGAYVDVSIHLPFQFQEYIKTRRMRFFKPENLRSSSSNLNNLKLRFSQFNKFSCWKVVQYTYRYRLTYTCKTYLKLTCFT